MKTTYILLLFFILLLSLPSQADTITGKCVSVTDGDTIKVLVNNREVKVRIDAIDCPEKSQDFGQRAKQFTSSLVFGKVVTVNVGKIDRYGRSVGRVIVDGKDVSLELVRAGLAWHYKKYSDDPVLAKAEEEARAKKIGLWSMANPVAPWDYRHKK